MKSNDWTGLLKGRVVDEVYSHAQRDAALIEHQTSFLTLGARTKNLGEAERRSAEQIVSVVLLLT